jgi:hypothetical protein
MKNQKGSHQVNIEKEQQRTPHPKRIAPTNVHSRLTFNGDDYG